MSAQATDKSVNAATKDLFKMENVLTILLVGSILSMIGYFNLPKSLSYTQVNKLYWIGKMDYWESGINWGFALLVVGVSMFLCWAFAS